MSDAQHKSIWKNRWTFIMAATGSAVGLGNIWKFPYITGEYGGGAFVLVYLFCILLVGIPVMMAEVMLGRIGRTDPINSMLSISKKADRSANWSVIGYMGVITGLLILMFYSVVAGWVIDYFVQSVTGAYQNQTPEQINEGFGLLYADNTRELIWHTLFIAVTTWVVARGVTNGIGKTVETLMPVLFILLCVMLGYSMANGEFMRALAFMFTPDFSKVTPDAILEALGHAFFTLSLGMGAIMVYGAYMPKKSSIGKTVLLVGFFDTLIALIAGLVIFPLVFANGMESDQSVGLMFKTLPIVFSQMPGGIIFGSIFFALVSIAALSSAISLIEPGVAWLETRGVARVKSAISLAAVAWLGGVLCLFYGPVFDFLDNLTTRFTLPLGGLLIALFVGWALPTKDIHRYFNKTPAAIYTLWLWSVRVVAPAGVAIIMAVKLSEWLA